MLHFDKRGPDAAEIIDKPADLHDIPYVQRGEERGIVQDDGLAEDHDGTGIFPYDGSLEVGFIIDFRCAVSVGRIMNAGGPSDAETVPVPGVGMVHAFYDFFRS